MPGEYIKSTGYQKLFKKAKPVKRETIGSFADAKAPRAMMVPADRTKSREELAAREERRRAGSIKGGIETKRRHKGPPPSRVGM